MNTAAFSSEERKFTSMHIRWMCCRQSCVRPGVFSPPPIWNKFGYTTWLCSYDACRLEYSTRAKSVIYVYIKR